jgi:hypothetical protein
MVVSALAAVLGGAVGLGAWVVVQRGLQQADCEPGALCSPVGALGLWPLVGAAAVEWGRHRRRS